VKRIFFRRSGVVRADRNALNTACPPVSVAREAGRNRL
jgi:hypothetical protein